MLGYSEGDSVPERKFDLRTATWTAAAGRLHRACRTTATMMLCSSRKWRWRSCRT